MRFLKILDTFGSALAWIIILAVIWGIYPFFVKLFSMVQSVHDFAK